MAVAAAPGPGTVRWPWRYWTRQVIWAAVDLVFPPECAGCGRPGQRFCAGCRSSLAGLTPPLCQTCGYPTERPGQCPRCLSASTVAGTLAGIRSVAFFEGALQKAIHHFKYRHDRILADTFAALMVRAGSAQPLPGNLVVPVPLAPERLHERGYNQAALLARTYAELRGLPWSPSAARRVRPTASQVGLSASERRQNVAGAFEGDRRTVAGRALILVDDVCTTGATLAACAEALLAAGATEVWGLTVARARLPHAQSGSVLSQPDASTVRAGAEP